MTSRSSLGGRGGSRNGQFCGRTVLIGCVKCGQGGCLTSPKFCGRHMYMAPKSEIAARGILGKEDRFQMSKERSERGSSSECGRGRRMRLDGRKMQDYHIWHSNFGHDPSVDHPDSQGDEEEGMFPSSVTTCMNEMATVEGSAITEARTA